MYPPGAAPPNISFYCADEEIFIFLEKIGHGCPLPPNVHVDVNPYDRAPCDLPDGIWFLIRSKEKEPTKLGFWKTKVEACKLFSSSSITGWRTTLEFFEGQVPHELKSHWLMQEFWITQKGLPENSKVKGAMSLCRVFPGGELDPDHQKEQKMPSLHTAGETFIHATQSIVSMAHVTNSSSTSNLAVEKDDQTENLVLTGEPANYLVEMPPDNDYFSRGDYLELLDLDNPATPSSSENSSCVTMSSDECFDSLALLKELDSEINQELVQKDENCKFGISASLRPNEMTIAPASPGLSSMNSPASLASYSSRTYNIPIQASFISKNPPTEEVLGSSQPGLADGHKDVGSSALHDPVRKQKVNHKEAGPSNSHDVGTPWSFHVTSREAAKGRKKKLKNKFLCFMPFYFF